ncbi:MAG: HEAT repeat domain-containing protein [Victivallaceae bacterium]
MQKQFYTMSAYGRKSIGNIYALWSEQGVKSLSALLQSGVDGRKILLEALGETGSAKAIPVLEQYLDSNTWEAARALVAIGPASAEVLKEKSIIYHDCALGYGKVSGTRGVEHLAKLIHNPSSEVARYALLGLGYSQSDEANQLLIEQYPHFKGMARQAVISSLSRLGKKSSIPVIKEAINDDFPGVRIAAIYAFMNIDRTVGENLIVEKLKDSEPIVVRDAAWSAGHLATPKALPSLIYLVNESKDKYILRAVAFALSKIIANPQISSEDQAKCRKALLKLSRHEWHEIRTHAENGLKGTNVGGRM